MYIYITVFNILQLHTLLLNTKELWCEINLPHNVHIHQNRVEIYTEIALDVAVYGRVRIKETPSW